MACKVCSVSPGGAVPNWASRNVAVKYTRLQLILLSHIRHVTFEKELHRESLLYKTKQKNRINKKIKACKQYWEHSTKFKIMILIQIVWELFQNSHVCNRFSQSKVMSSAANISTASKPKWSVYNQGQ